MLQSTSGGRELQDCLAENQAEIERLEIEVAWCAGYLTARDRAGGAVRRQLGLLVGLVIGVDAVFFGIYRLAELGRSARESSSDSPCSGRW